MEASESLKKMIRSWLDDTFPGMPESERIALSEAMDVTLIEKMKEQSMRTFFEINNVIRMSFIEMQYMKKVSFVAMQCFHSSHPLHQLKFLSSIPLGTIRK